MCDCSPFTVSHMSHEFFILIPLAFVSGAINAAIGGGGLILLPGLFSVLPKALPAAVMGTDKLAAVFGHFSSLRQYARHIDIPWRLLLPASIAAFFGSYLGASVVYLLPVTYMRWIVMVMLAVMLVFTWFRPHFGKQDTARQPTQRDLIAGFVLGALIGFYDGFFGPGTGTFLIFLFVHFFHFDFLRASACAKIVNISTNLAALAFFVPAGTVLYHFGIPMGIAMAFGAVIGTRLALKGGNKWIRRLFLVLALILLSKLLWQTFQPYL